jgi:hypothetical protein
MTPATVVTAPVAMTQTWQIVVVMNAASHGNTSAKKFRCHHIVQGAATSSRPVSMKYAAMNRRVT